MKRDLNAQLKMSLGVWQGELFELMKIMAKLTDVHFHKFKILRWQSIVTKKKKS